MKTVLESLFNKVEKGDFLLKRLFIKKETSTQVFSGEYCEKIKKFFLKNLSGGYFLESEKVTVKFECIG